MSEKPVEEAPVVDAPVEAAAEEQMEGMDGEVDRPEGELELDMEAIGDMSEVGQSAMD
jgi:hypothetical protein